MTRGMEAAIRGCLAGVMFILVPVCWVVADVLASAIQFDVITHDVFIVTALPSEIGVAFPVAEHCDCGFVGSNNDRQGVAMRRNQGMAVGGIAVGETRITIDIHVIRCRGVQLNAPTMRCVGIAVVAMRINVIIVNALVRIVGAFN